MILESILGLGTGFIGNIITSVTNYKVQKLKNEHEAVMAEIEIRKLEKESEISKAEAQAGIEIKRIENEGYIEIGSINTLKESIKAASRESAESAKITGNILDKLLKGNWFVRSFGLLLSMMFGVTDIVRRAIRPALTIYLVGVSTWITIKIYNIMQIQANNADITALQAVSIFNYLTEVLTALTMTCVGWYFADRRVAKFLKRLNKGE